jgi:hypothetical protein
VDAAPLIAQFLTGRFGVVGAAGIEPATVGLEIRCSIRLSYAPILFTMCTLQATLPWLSWSDNSCMLLLFP